MFELLIGAFIGSAALANKNSETMDDGATPDDGSWSETGPAKAQQAYWEHIERKEQERLDRLRKHGYID